MGDTSRLSGSEDEEDLELLRLAALQSLKRKNQSSGDVMQSNQFLAHKDNLNHFNGLAKGRHKKGKFFRPNTNRTPRNGQFHNNWTRNSNLISVPMISDETERPRPPSEAPKLILPQDRYCKKGEDDTNCPESGSSKFDRYNNSDESESESEVEEDDEEVSPSRSEKEESSELKRANSLEELMAELENEIQGMESKPKEEKPKTKSPKKKRKISTGASESEANKKGGVVAKENLKPDTSKKPGVVEKKPEVREVAKPDLVEVKKPGLVEINKTGLVESRRGEFKEVNRKASSGGSFPPRPRKWQGKPRRHNYPPPPAMEFIPPPTPPNEIIIPTYAPPTVPPPFPPYAAPPMTFENPPVYQTPPPPMMYDVPPPCLPSVYDRPLSPLMVNTDAFSNAPTFAPLSPRSAAFVLENRAIIEKRKRRSYSRSPSPRFRRSLSPPKRRSLTPPSNRKQLPPKLTGGSPKRPVSIRERLGIKPGNKTEEEGDKTKKVASKDKEEKKPEVVDPVLEARRKKFETNELTIKEGVIRLKAKGEPETKKVEETPLLDEEEIDEDALLEGADDAIELDPKIDVLFSDEESNSDNEGRFKAKQESGQKVSVLPFTKLINGSKSAVKTQLDEKRNERNARSRNERRKRIRSRSPLKRAPLRTSVRKSSERGKLAPFPNERGKPASFPSERGKPAPFPGEKGKPTPFPMDNRKIEIKIRNPSKYERAEEQEAGEKVSGRKVEIARKPEPEESNDNKEAGGESVEEPNENINEGDLRAQLSRKRAERQKHPLPDVVPTRLLQNALQGVGFKKSKKNKKQKDENTDSGKLPIHLRLGIAAKSPPEVSGKKSRKHKNRRVPEQV